VCSIQAIQFTLNTSVAEPVAAGGARKHHSLS
jgi:hypothetical protein